MKRRKNETRLKLNIFKDSPYKAQKTKLSKAPCVKRRSLGGLLFQHDQLIPVSFMYGHYFQPAGFLSC